MNFFIMTMGQVLAYLLRHEQETLLVVANLSRFVRRIGPIS